jgi:hypothetical protein
VFWGSARCRQEGGSSGKVRLSKAETAASQKREQMAAAAEARMARLQLLSQQQQLWWRIHSPLCMFLMQSVWSKKL